MSTITERVAAGAAFLDEHDPDWWREDVERAIDLDKLDLGESDRCILGQRCPLEVLASYLETDTEDLSAPDFGDTYFAYSERLSGLHGAGLPYWARDHGFTFITVPGEASALEIWDDLTAEWKRVITGRRAAP